MPPDRQRFIPSVSKVVVGSASCGVAMGAPGRRGGRPPRRRGTPAGRHGFPHGLHRLLRAGAAARPAASRRAAGELRPHDPGDDSRPIGGLRLPRRPSAEPGFGPFPSAKSTWRRADPTATRPALPRIQSVPEWSGLDFYRRQQKVILRNCGSIAPESLDETIARGTYRGAARALGQMKPEEVIEEMVRSGLRGRGGAAFPTGQKWRLARQAEADVKYIVCNADEGEPGAYMDRTVLEGDPHAVLEGMLIGSYAIGAREGFIYVRNEYPLAIEILEHAIQEAEKRGLLGDDLFGSGWSFRVTVRRGAGAYICGEETALIESLEGHSGEPRSRPPYPVTAGLWGKPTVVNNVKTWASVAPILTRGAAWYAGMGTKRTPGTTIFSLEGAVKNAGLVEVPFGITLRDLVYEIGGGIQGDRPLKAIQAGGAARGCIPPSMLDLAIDTEDRPGETITIGTGGIIVLDDTACTVDMARFLVGFFLEESCGKCVPCREGTKQMHRILTRICDGRAAAGDLALLERLARTVRSAAVCGMGGMAPERRFDDAGALPRRVHGPRRRSAVLGRRVPETLRKAHGGSVLGNVSGTLRVPSANGIRSVPDTWGAGKLAAENCVTRRRWMQPDRIEFR